MSDLTEKARQLKNAYQREWKRRNPDKVKKYCQSYWEKKAAKKQYCLRCGDLLTDHGHAPYCDVWCQAKAQNQESQ
jgi:hypothetical protein